MKILQTNNYQQTNFKSTYPVIHRVLKNGVYIPVSDFGTVKKLQGKLVRVLNSSWEKMLKSLDKEALQNVLKWTNSASLEKVKPQLQLPKTEKEAMAIFRGRMGFYDLDYAYAPKKEAKKEEGKIKKNLKGLAEQRVRTFYNREKGLLDGRYYLTYMLSGKTIGQFEDELAKIIGTEKHKALNATNNAYSETVKKAIDDYNKRGINFVNDGVHRLKSKLTGMTYILRANFEPILNKAGIIKDYKFISAKFVPEYTK